MATIVNFGGGTFSMEYVEIGAIASSYNGIDVKVIMVPNGNSLVTTSTGEYLSFSFPANGTGQCTVLKDCTVSYASSSGKTSFTDMATAKYKAGDVVGGGGFAQRVLVVLVHKPE